MRKGASRGKRQRHTASPPLESEGAQATVTLVLASMLAEPISDQLMCLCPAGSCSLNASAPWSEFSQCTQRYTALF